MNNVIILDHTFILATNLYYFDFIKVRVLNRFGFRINLEMSYVK